MTAPFLPQEKVTAGTPEALGKEERIVYTRNIYRDCYLEKTGGSFTLRIYLRIVYILGQCRNPYLQVTTPVIPLSEADLEIEGESSKIGLSEIVRSNGS